MKTLIQLWYNVSGDDLYTASPPRIGSKVSTLGASSPMRLFFAAFPDRETRRLIASAVSSLMLGDDARLVPCENYHITLAFVGEVSDAQAALLRTIVPLEVPAFTVRFDTCEHWLRSEVLVLAASEYPPALHDLQCKLRSGLAHNDFAPDPTAIPPTCNDCEKGSASPCAASDVRISVEVNRISTRAVGQIDHRIHLYSTGSLVPTG